MTVGRYCKWKELHKRKLQKISRLKWSISFPQFAIRDEISFLGSNAFKKIVSWGVEKNQSEIKEVSEEQLKLSSIKLHAWKVFELVSYVKHFHYELYEVLFSILSEAQTLSFASLFFQNFLLCFVLQLFSFNFYEPKNCLVCLFWAWNSL